MYAVKDTTTGKEIPGTTTEKAHLVNRIAEEMNRQEGVKKYVVTIV